LGQVVREPRRISFDPFPWESFAVWIMTQMKRWGQVRGDIDYQGIAQQVYLATDARRLMREVGLNPPAENTKKFTVMGKEFDPAKPEEYIASFAIRRT
jgi:nitrate/nitrite transport system substrate-binding protein